MKKIEDLFKEKLTWKDEAESSDIFIANQYAKEVCYLRMNDFPDEPMWTLYYHGESIDFDDAPEQWEITYRSELK